MTARNAFGGLALDDSIGTDGGTAPDFGTGVRGWLRSQLAAMRDGTHRVRIFGLSPSATQVQLAVDASGNLINSVSTALTAFDVGSGQTLELDCTGMQLAIILMQNAGQSILLEVSADAGATWRDAGETSTYTRMRGTGTFAAELFNASGTSTQFPASDANNFYRLPVAGYNRVRVRNSTTQTVGAKAKIYAYATGAQPAPLMRLAASTAAIGAVTASLTAGVGTSVGQGIFTRGTYAAYASTTALLAAGATYTATGFTSLYPTMRFQIVSDQPGTLVIRDSASRAIRTYAVTAVTGGNAWFVDIADANLGSTSSFTFTNTGGSTQTVFALNAYGVSP